jgi:methylated-DNA-protein-cysteine methyltransferase related protein
MAKSAAFSRIKSQVLAIVQSIPSGRVSTYRSIGEHLAVMPRHVAYILTMLTEAELGEVPWYRVVAEAGSISTPKQSRSTEQGEALGAEGIQFSGAKSIANFTTVFIAASDLDSGIPPQVRDFSPPT